MPPARLARLVRGFNLTGWLDGPDGHRPDLDLLATLHRRGFTNVRLPVAGERLMPEFAAAADIARDTAELDFAIDTLIGIGFSVSLDLHPGERLDRLEHADASHAIDLIAALWQALARRYGGRPAEALFFEVLNEPPFDRETWIRGGNRLIQAIRGEAPEHTIIIGTTGFERTDALSSFPPFPQANLVYAVHFYDPLVFTHQGADWSDGPLRDLHDVPFPVDLSHPAIAALLADSMRDRRAETAAFLKQELARPWTAARVRSEIDAAGTWASSQGRPVVLNEFGVLAQRAPAADRLAWLDLVSRTAERNCIGWALWDYAGGFGFVRREGDHDLADEKLLHVLLDRPLETRR